MSKAVLVMDMPESCDMCDLTDMVNGKMYCGAPGCGKLTEDYISCRPDWCPLRPLPEKKKLSGDVHNVQSMAEEIAAASWNDCLDAIIEEGKNHE